jgi:thiol-disulfide isomerase/thioredoxin
MKTWIVTLSFIFLSITGFSQNKLIGKKAPKIEVENWIYPKIKVPDWEVREIPESFEGRIIVLDFWFTRCAPCVASIPELNFLAKNYPEILFLSISFENEKPIDDFLNKMVLFYPVGTDPYKKTINAFDVHYYPETFLIDKNGIVQWQGSPFKLNKEILNKVTGRAESQTKLVLPNNETKSMNSAYSFTIQQHNLEMGESSYFHYNPFEINILNRNLENLLNVFYGINKPRIINQKKLHLDTPFDIILKTDKNVTTESNCVEMLRYLLPRELGFEIKQIELDTISRKISISQINHLKENISNEPFFGNAIRYDNWEASGARLTDLKNFFENHYNMLIELENETNTKYNFILPINDILLALDKLETTYGIKLIDTKTKTTFWVLE